MTGLSARFIAGKIVEYMKKQAWTQGMGRHSLQDAINFGLGDVQALSDFLGESSSLTEFSF